MSRNLKKMMFAALFALFAAFTPVTLPSDALSPDSYSTWAG